MKLVTAIIQPDKLEAVRDALVKAEIYRISVSRCAGRGRAEDVELYRGQLVAPHLLPKTRIDIACTEEYVDVAITAILNAARHGHGEVGDGKIFVTPLEKCIRIRTGEEGSDAI